MDTLLFHPKLVHVPMALGILMPLLATGVLLAWWRKWLPARAWVIAVLFQALLVGSGVLALQSGEAEEERVEHVVPEAAVEAHEEAASAFVWASAAVLAVMVVGLAVARRRPGLSVAAVATVGTLVVLGLGYRTGEAGGRLVYQHGAASAHTTGAIAPVTRPATYGEHDDDD